MRGGVESSDESSADEVEEAEYARLREAAHARRETRRERWKAAGGRLAVDGFAIIDDFLGADAIADVARSVRALYSSDASPFTAGKTGGGRDGTGRKFSATVVRGDQVAVIADGEEARVTGLSALLRQADELVGTMAAGPVPDLRGITSRSRPMLAIYPGNGARCALASKGYTWGWRTGTCLAASVCPHMKHLLWGRRGGVGGLKTHLLVDRPLCHVPLS